MRRIWIRVVSFLAALVLLATGLLAAGCAPSAPEGTEIRIGVMGGQTGPAASSVVTMFKEIEAIFKYINEVDGGINGVKLSWRIVDNKGTPEGAAIAYKELRDGFNPVLYVVVEDYYYLGIKDTIEQDKSVLLCTSALNSKAYIPPGRFFSVAIPTADGLAGYIKWVKQNWKGTGNPKVGILYWDLPSGETWRTAQAWIAKQGVDLVPVQYPYATMDLKPQLMKLRDAGVNYVWMMGHVGQAPMAVRDFRSLGLADKMTFTFMEMVESQILISLVGEAAEGFYIYRSETAYADGSEAAKLYMKILETAGGQPKWSDNRLTMNIKAVIEAAVKQAVADVGWKNLNGDAIYNALNKLTTIDTKGNSIGFGYGPDRRVGVSTTKMMRFTKTGTVSVSDPIPLPRLFEGVEK